MGLIKGAFNAAGNISIMGKLKQWVWEKAEPKVADFVRGVDYSTFIEGSKEAQEYDTKCTDAEKADYEAKGADLMKAFENLGKCDSGERNIDAAMFDVFKDIADKYKDDPGKIGYCIYEHGDDEYVNDIQNVVTIFNEKFAALEASGAEINYKTPYELADNDEEFKAAWDKLGSVIKNIEKHTVSDPEDEASSENSAEKLSDGAFHNDLFKDSVKSSFVETTKTIPVIGNFIANKQDVIEEKFDNFVERLRDKRSLKEIEADEQAARLDKALAPIAEKHPELASFIKAKESDMTSNGFGKNKVEMLQQSGIYMPDDEQTGTSNTETSAENDDI